MTRGGFSPRGGACPWGRGLLVGRSPVASRGGACSQGRGSIAIAAKGGVSSGGVAFSWGRGSRLGLASVASVGGACPRGRGSCGAGPAPSLTLGRLGLHEGLDEQVGGLGVERQGVAQGLQVGALLQEGLLEAHAARVEVLLREKSAKRVTHPRVCVRGPGPRDSASLLCTNFQAFLNAHLLLCTYAAATASRKLLSGPSWGSPPHPYHCTLHPMKVIRLFPIAWGASGPHSSPRNAVIGEGTRGTLSIHTLPLLGL